MVISTKSIFVGGEVGRLVGDLVGACVVVGEAVGSWVGSPPDISSKPKRVSISTPYAATASKKLRITVKNLIVYLFVLNGPRTSAEIPV